MLKREPGVRCANVGAVSSKAPRQSPDGRHKRGARGLLVLQHNAVRLWADDGGS